MVSTKYSTNDEGDIMRKAGRFQKAVDSIANLKANFDTLGLKLPPMMFGKYGELKARIELEEKIPDVEVEYKSGQSKNDINLVRSHKKPVRIEVKTSRFKKESYGEGYGFALHIKKCTEHPKAYFWHKRRRRRLEGDLCYFNFLICVCLSEDLQPKYYIFPRKELEQNLEDIKNESVRFSHSPYRIIIPVKPKLQNLKPFDKKVYDHPENYVNRWDTIEKALEK